MSADSLTNKTISPNDLPKLSPQTFIHSIFWPPHNIAYQNMLRPLLVLLAGIFPFIHCSSDYVARCSKDSDPDTWTWPWDLPAPTPNDPYPSGNSYLGNADLFKQGKISTGVCTPFKVISDWDDTLVESGDSIVGRIKGGDNSDPGAIGSPYKDLGSLLNTLVCGSYEKNAGGHELRDFDRYLTVLTANGLDGKDKWSEKPDKILAVYNAVGFSEFGKKLKDSAGHGRVSVLGPRATELPAAANNILHANIGNDTAGGNYWEFCGSGPTSVESCTALPEFTQLRMQLQMQYKARQYQLSAIGQTKTNNFTQYAPHFPEFAGSNVFFGDDGQADLTEAATGMLPIDDANGNPQLAFAAIHSTDALAHWSPVLFGARWGMRYNFAFRQMIFRIMNRRFAPRQAHGNKPRFFYFTDYADLRSQLGAAGWINTDEEQGDHSTAASNSTYDPIFVNEVLRVNSSPEEKANEKAIVDALAALQSDVWGGQDGSRGRGAEIFGGEPTAWPRGHMSWGGKYSLATDLAKAVRQAYCQGSEVKQQWKVAAQRALPDHALQVLYAFGGKWSYDSFPRFSGIVPEDCKDTSTWGRSSECGPARNLEHFCGLTSDQLGHRYTWVDAGEALASGSPQAFLV